MVALGWNEAGTGHVDGGVMGAGGGGRVCGSGEGGVGNEMYGMLGMR